MGAVQDRAEWVDDGGYGEWDEFASSHPAGRIYHLSGWKRVLESSFPHIRFSVAVLRDPVSRRIVAGIPVCHVRSWLLGDRLVSVPFAPVSDPLVRNAADIDALMPLVVERGREVGAKRAEVRISTLWETLKAANSFSSFIQCGNYVHHYVDVNRPLEAVWQAVDRKSIRYMVNKARKAGLEVVTTRSEKELSTIYGLICHSRRRLGLPPIPWRFFQAMRNELEPAGKMIGILIVNKGAAASGLICLRSGPFFSLEYCGDDEASRSTGSPQLSYWAAIEMANRLGCHEASLGRSSTHSDGLVRYKERWGCRGEQLHVLMHAFGKPIGHGDRESSLSYKMVRALSHTLPDWFYHRLGDFCYRHMG